MSDIATSPPPQGAELLGRKGEGILAATRAANLFLRSHSTEELLSRVGSTIAEIPDVEHLTKDVFQASYGGRVAGPPNDVLTGLGLFFITEQRTLMLDCTAGHYQMTWGYQHPVLDAAVREGMAAGIVPDDHSNIPGAPVKRLSYKLVETCNPTDEAIRECDASGLAESDDVLNTVLLGIVTGSVACSTALKIMLMNHEQNKSGVPVMMTLEGNYHGTDLFAQRMRHMWEPYFANVEFVNIEPNDIPAMEQTFAQYGERIMGFMLEPIMMNREAVLVQPEFAQALRRLCDQAGALIAVDEIQTGFWYPGCFHYKLWDIVPDFVICGKGMAAGFHALSATIYRRPLDLLAQYDSISTNGNAPLAAYVALHSIAMIEAQGERIGAVAAAYEAMLQEVAQAHAEAIVSVQGQGFLSGLKFRTVAQAMSFHRQCIDAGLWLRVHAYHEGHSTVLTKFALVLDAQVIDSVRSVFMRVLANL